VAIAFRQRGTGRESGVQIERDFFGVYDLRGSKVVRYRMYESRDQALEAAGLSDR
jgi:ketosteroid isomerase-like protein